MHTEHIASSLHRFSEKDWPNQMAIAQLVYDARKSKIEMLPAEKVEWESIPSEDRVSILCDCVSLFICEIDRIEQSESSSKSIDDVMINLYGKGPVDKMKSENPETYNAMCSGMKSYASQKCTEQRKNVLNHLTKTPFFIKHRIEFPRSLVLQAPEPKL